MGFLSAAELSCQTAIALRSVWEFSSPDFSDGGGEELVWRIKGGQISISKMQEIAGRAGAKLGSIPSFLKWKMIFFLDIHDTRLIGSRSNVFLERPGHIGISPYAKMGISAYVGIGRDIYWKTMENQVIT